MTNHGERIATIEAEVVHLKKILKEMREEDKRKETAKDTWLRRIATGVLFLFATSMLNAGIWVAGKYIEYTSAAH